MHCVRRHVALRREPEHADPAAPDAPVHGALGAYASNKPCACTLGTMLTLVAVHVRRRSRRSRSSRAPQRRSNGSPARPRLRPRPPPLNPACAVLHRYKEGGPAAEARFEAGVAGYEARAFRGCGVFTSGARTALRPLPALAQKTPTDRRSPRFPAVRRALRGLGRRRLGADAHALVADRRVLRHDAAAGRADGEQPAHGRHAHLRRGVGQARAHHLGRGAGSHHALRA